MAPPNILLSTTLLLLIIIPHSTTSPLPFPLEFNEAPAFRNGKDCPQIKNHQYPTTTTTTTKNHQDSTTIHIAMTLDYSSPYLRGSIAAILSVLQHATCPENTFFHFITTTHSNTFNSLNTTITTTFPFLNFDLYYFNPSIVNNLISSSIRSALDQPLNYARIYISNLLPSHINRIIYLDSDLIVVDDIYKLWQIELNDHPIGAPEYCLANFTMYFTSRFWSTHWSKMFKKSNSRACYFNTGVMVLDLEKWRIMGYTKRLEYWMRVQKIYRIYELGSLPPFLLVFAGDVQGVEHRWNQHGLGGDNLEGLCRNLHPGPVSLLHWSGKGKPWLRLDSKKPCPLDSLWAPYDLFKHESLFSDS